MYYSLHHLFTDLMEFDVNIYLHIYPYTWKVERVLCVRPSYISERVKILGRLSFTQYSHVCLKSKQSFLGVQEGLWTARQWRFEFGQLLMRCYTRSQHIALLSTQARRLSARRLSMVGWISTSDMLLSHHTASRNQLTNWTKKRYRSHSSVLYCWWLFGLAHKDCCAKSITRNDLLNSFDTNYKSDLIVFWSCIKMGWALNDLCEVTTFTPYLTYIGLLEHLSTWDLVGFCTRNASSITTSNVSWTISTKHTAHVPVHYLKRKFAKTEWRARKKILLNWIISTHSNKTL